MKFVDSVEIDKPLGGLTTYVVPTKVKDVVTIAGSFLGGTVHSLNQNNKIPSITAAMLDKGTKDKSKYEIRNTLESLGAEIGFVSSKHHINFTAHCLQNDLPVVINLLVEQLREPLFSDEELELLKKQVIGNLERSKEDTKKQAHFKLLMNLFPSEHPNHANTIDDSINFVKKINTKDLADFYQKSYGMGTINIVAAGDVSPSQLNNLLTKELKGWEKQRVKIINKEIAAHNRCQSSEHINIKDKTSSDMYIGQSININDNNANYLELMMGIYILGGNFSARLMQTVRDQQGLTYGIGSGISGCSYGINGYWYTWGTFAPEMIDKGIKSTKDQIENWFKNGISDKELEAKKTTINGLFNVSLDTTSGLVDKILTNAEKGRNISYLDEYQDKIKGLEKNKINDYIQSNIDTNLLSITIAGSNI